MTLTSENNKKAYDKTLFTTGQYVQHFKPDEKRNPFHNIYNEKKLDVVNIITKSNFQSILDIGGGMGRVSIPLAEDVNRKIVLCDLSVDMLNLAIHQTDKSHDIKFVNADAHHLPFQDNSFDVIVGLDLFCHLSEPNRALSEFFRIMVNQGTLILDSTNSNPLWTLFYPRYLGKNPINWIKTILYRGVLPGWEKLVKHYPKKVFFSFLHNAGFKIMENIDYGPALCSKWHLTVSKKI